MTNLNPNLFPLVYDLKIVDSTAFPELEMIDMETANVNIAIDSIGNMYAVRVIGVNTISIELYRRQDFHLHYYVASSVSTINNANQTPSSVLFRSRFDTNDNDKYLFIMYNKDDDTIGIKRYTVTPIGLNDDLWSISIPLHGALDITTHQSGLTENEASLFYYKYYLDNNAPAGFEGCVIIYTCLKNDSNSLTHIRTVTGLPPDLNNVTLSLDKDDQTFYICSGTSVFLATFDGIIDDPPLDNRQVAPSIDLVAAASCLVDTVDDNVISTVYQYRDGGFHFGLTGGTDPNQNGAASNLELPMIYDLNRLDMYQEDHDPEQGVYQIVLKSLNQVVYMAYVTSDLQIRIVKLLYYRGTNDARFKPLIIWSTRLGTVDYFYGTGTAAGGIKLLVNNNEPVGTDQDNSRLYVVIRNGDSGITRVWMIEEYIIDLGHNISTITAPVDTIPMLLQSLRDNYTIGLQNVVPGFPTVNDVIIGNIEESGRNIKIRFDYIDYDMLVLYPDIRDDMKNSIAQALSDLYRGSNINVIDVNGSSIPEGGDNFIIFSVPRGTLLKPCVARGTEILVRDTSDLNIKTVPVELVKVGDYVINQLGTPVRVLDHLSSKIWCQKHNAPYVIPEGFFGEMRPYKELLISGDHAILVGIKTNNHTVVYAQNIKILKQRMVKRELEYHHLLLEDHDKNFYLANGLEVESLHPGTSVYRSS